MPRSVRPLWKDVKTNYKLAGTHSCSLVFPNTCAIRMSEALVAAESALLNHFKTSGKNICPHGYVRGAQDLASILRNVWGKHDLGWVTPGSKPKNITGKRGVICYMNIPGYSGQGHIDLWNKTAPVGQAYWKASPIWFWKL
ncbi:hypothetical protein PN36_33895 [Candidatus Thiomargarita nelsonii]|uniref:Uncharacterized protein n=1 Tax=Candidatus Thiomargarita nelsonii TaxID=1003181 RepID=A0A0A6PDP1_9GAMM|nr:hypothetical protein PN36_33895 [Candidatus Thiomargarita nelsonii]